MCYAAFLLCGRVHHAPERDLPDAAHPRPPSAPQHVVRTSDGVKVGVGFHVICMQTSTQENLGGEERRRQDVTHPALFTLCFSVVLHCTLLMVSDLGDFKFLSFSFVMMPK